MNKEKLHFLEYRYKLDVGFDIFIFNNSLGVFQKTELPIDYLLHENKDILNCLNKHHFSTKRNTLIQLKNCAEESFNNLKSVNLIYEKREELFQIFETDIIVHCCFCNNEIICKYCGNAGKIDLWELDKKALPELEDYFKED